MDKKKNGFASGIGFVLAAAGSAVGLGNLWGFPYKTHDYGGAAFVLVYIACVLFIGVVTMVCEIFIGRRAQANPVTAFKKVNKKVGWFGVLAVLIPGFIACYYSVLGGYTVRFTVNSFAGNAGTFAPFAGSIWQVILFSALFIGTAVFIVMAGVKGGIEKASKVLMPCLFIILVGTVIFSLCLGEGVKEGLEFYLKPDFSKLSGTGILAAMGQAFFTLSIGVGSMAIFGSYIGKERRLAGESVIIIALDTLIAFMAGMIIFPICFSYGVEVNAGPGLIFVSLPNIFNNMTGGRFWGALFFIFLSLAALTTVIAVVENLIAFFIDEMKLSRKAAALITGTGVAICSLPCVFGFNIWKDVQPLGGGSSILDFEDFIVSQNLLPIGSLLIVLYCALNWNAFMEEVNTGKGMIFPEWMKNYCRYILPLIVVVIFVWGYLKMFS